MTTDPVLIDGTQYEISIEQIMTNSKIRDQLTSTTLLDFDTNITKFDYEENVNSLDSVILAKAYDCSDIVNKSIIELDPQNPQTWDVKLIYETRDEQGNLSGYPTDFGDY